MPVNWMGEITVNGITFSRGDNGVHLFYETVANSVTWCILRNHTRKPALPGMGRRPGEIPHWSVIVEHRKHGWLKAMNSIVVELGGQETHGPLCDCTDSGYTDPPLRLLAGVADMINREADPWRPASLTSKPREGQP